MSADPAAGRPALVERVAIVGAGAMGAGIAQVCVAAGHPVVLHDTDPAALAAAPARVAGGLDRWVARGRIDGPTRARAGAALGTAATLEAAVGGSSFVIEATVEDPEVKAAVFAAVDAAAPPGAVLATNTSSLSVADLAAATRRPESVLGLHFFNPAPLMTLVELVATPRTSPSAADRADAFARSLGKVPVRCSDTPGFIVNRVGRPYVVEAVRMLEAGEGDVAGIDAALEAAGYPMGPFRLLDLIGLDVDLAIDERLHHAFRAERFRPPELQRRLVADGRLGRKRGHGFYAYPPDAEAGVAPLPTLPSLAASREGVAPLEPAAIVERLELACVNEAYRAVEEGVALPPAIDEAMRLGAGHPAGPFERLGGMGPRAAVERLRRLSEATAARSGDQYRVAPLLWQMATA